MPPCEVCAADNLKWVGIVDRTHTYELATKITKTKAWKAYRQAKPFDEHEATLSLDVIMESGVIIADTAPQPSEAYMDAEELAERVARLTPKQLHVYEQLTQGFSSREIYLEQGYKSTGGVRYHRHAIRKKFLKGE